MHSLEPSIGQWYMRRDTGHKFEVISVEDDGTVELQDEEGSLDEMDAEAWLAQQIELSEPPQDFSALYDIASPDEADGGDPIEPDVPDAQPLRVAEEERLSFERRTSRS